MAGRQSVVALGGLGLAGVNLYTGGQWPALSAVIFGSSSADAAGAHKILLSLGAELLLVLVLVVVAGQSDAMGLAMVCVVTALWVLWAMGYYSKKGA